MIQAVIFDMDGVIVDSEPYQFLAFQDLFQEYGVKLTRENFNGVGRTAKENIELLMKKWRIQGDLRHRLGKAGDNGIHHPGMKSMRGEEQMARGSLASQRLLHSLHGISRA